MGSVPRRERGWGQCRVARCTWVGSVPQGGSLGLTFSIMLLRNFGATRRYRVAVLTRPKCNARDGTDRTQVQCPRRYCPDPSAMPATVLTRPKCNARDGTDPTQVQ